MLILYLTAEQIPSIHQKTIEKSGGGTLNVLDSSRLLSVLEHIKNDDFYPEFHDKLTHLFYSVCQLHCFADGNKRLAITLSAQFLLQNGYMAIAQTFFEYTEMISLNVAAGKIDKKLLCKIFRAIMDGTYQTDESLKLEVYLAISV